MALLEAEFGAGRASDLLRYLRGPSGFSPGRVDWLERALRRGRVEDAAAALALWQGEDGEPPRDLERLRGGGRARPGGAGGGGRQAGGDDGLAAAARRGGRPAGAPGATGSSCARRRRSRRRWRSSPSWASWRRGAADLAATIAGLEFRVWSGPVEGRVRIASPYRLRAGRFDHVFVGSLQDGEFPRRDRGGDPFLSEAQRGSLGLDPRRDSEAEERYLFQVCLSLPRRRLVLSYRDSDESGGAEARSPLLDDIRALLAPAPDGTQPDPVEEAITRSRDLARVVHPLAEAPSENELARALAAHGPAADAAALLAAVGVDGAREARLLGRIAGARRAEAASRAPGPLDQPGGARLAGRGPRLRRHHPGAVRRLLLPLVHRPRARPAAARPGAGPAGPGRPDARRPRPPLPRAAGRRRAAAPGLAPRLDRPRAGAGRRDRRRARARRAPGRAGDGAAGRAPARTLPRRGGRARDRRLRALAAGGPLRRAARRRAADARARRLGPARRDRPGRPRRRRARRRHRLQALGLGHAAGEVRGAGEAAAAALPAGGGRALGRGAGRRPLPPAARDLGAAPARRRRRGRRRPTSPATTSTTRTSSTPRAWRSCWSESRRRAGEIVARMRGGEIRRDPGPRQGRGHDVCPTFCTFASICRRDRAPQYEEDVDVEER